MSLDDIEALTFDTGGTILDWHSGFRAALAEAGANHGIEKDSAALANELRRRSLKRMLKLGEHAPPSTSGAPRVRPIPSPTPRTTSSSTAFRTWPRRSAWRFRAWTH